MRVHVGSTAARRALFSLQAHALKLFFTEPLSVDASSRRLHISVDIKNPTGAFLTFCVVPPGQKLPSYQCKSACGGGQARLPFKCKRHTCHHRHDVMQRGCVTMFWTMQPLSDGIGLVQQHLSRGIWHVQYSVVFELHNTVLPVTGTFDAVVASGARPTSMFYNLGGHVDGALHYPLQAA